MEEAIAQAAPNNGASSAEDFQPTTQNPQGSTSGVQQQTGLQGVTNPQEFLDQNKTVELSVAAEPAAAQPQVNSSNVTMYAIITIGAIVLALIIFKLSNMLPKKQSQELDQADEINATTERLEPQKTTKKLSAKPKPKKTKRRNR